ncbi:MAG: hydantoinase/oxoprolinase family protein, partial [Acidimicrobiales bacterium]|nr:hydantoinase/oxoprolinase family protein [Acidimicrobiales bacterium]
MRLGVDVGGTFTDIVAVWEQGERGHARAKVPSDADDPAGAVLGACRLLASELGHDLGDLLADTTRFGLGTTVVTNLLAQTSGRRLGLITTAGFEDLVPLARGNRVNDGGWLVPPPALVERSAIRGVPERVDRRGEVVTPLDEVAVERAVEELGAAGVDAVVVSFLWSFRNPNHEHLAREVARRCCPSLPVVIGSDLAPVIREYDRTQFALLNAYVGGAVDWLPELAAELRAQGLAAPFVLTHSSGGATTVSGAREAPIGLAQSGPAAGAAASCSLAARMGEPDLVTCDLGGTSLDVALVAGGRALRRTRGSLLGHWTSMSMVDIDSVGSGGGSVAWADPVGAIRVGPRSAGASPGPAAYGRGGTEATLTDAFVVLGMLDPDGFLGGRMALNAGLAEDACARLGADLGLSPVDTAWGIREVAVATMARAVRNRIAGRGLVAGDLSLLAFGGAGGLVAADIAREVGARRAVVPELAPVFSAYGAATATLRRERVRSVAVRLPAEDPGALVAAYGELRAAVEADLDDDGVDAGTREIALEADVRFERQGAELTIGVPADGDGVPLLDDLVERFRSEYVRRFGEGAVAGGVIVELMTIRVVGQAVEQSAPATPAREPATVVVDRPSGVRAVALKRGAPPTEV